MAHIALILGGVRSGKSRFAQDLAHKLGGDDVLFVATAEARDAEMSRRIQIHQTTRPSAWMTLESAQNVGAAIAQRRSNDLKSPTLLIDCLTLLVSNVLLGCGDDASADIVEQRVAA